jgi:hypothetical protein
MGLWMGGDGAAGERGCGWVGMARWSRHRSRGERGLQAGAVMGVGLRMGAGWGWCGGRGAEAAKNGSSGRGHAGWTAPGIRAWGGGIRGWLGTARAGLP